ncbi:MAG TPA: universal stress protein, partial [Longimicrobiales bacterium]
MLRNVMLPLDGSGFSELAAPLAISIAKLNAATLHVVRVHVPTVPTAEVTLTTNYEELLREYEQAELERVAAQVRERGLAAAMALLEGPVAFALNAYCDDAAIDLVVMTTHGRDGLKRLVLGSVAEELVRTSGVPVLLAHPDSRDTAVSFTPERMGVILVPLDGTVEAESVLPHAVEFALMGNAELLLTKMVVPSFDVAITIGPDSLRRYLDHLRDQAEAYLAKVAARLPSDLRVRTAAATGETAAAGILACAEREKADLIAMVTHGRRGWQRIALGSVAESVTRNASMPVLLVRLVASTAHADVQAAG